MSLHHQGPMKLCFQREYKNKPGEKPYLTSCNGSGGRVVHAAVVGCNIYFSLQEKDPTAILVDTWTVLTKYVQLIPTTSCTTTNAEQLNDTLIMTGLSYR